MQIIFSPDANNDLDDLFAWIAQDDPKAAYDMITRIESSVRRLSIPGFAEIGRRGQVDRTRELVEAPYIIVYTIRKRADIILILGIFHARRER